MDVSFNNISSLLEEYKSLIESANVNPEVNEKHKAENSRIMSAIFQANRDKSQNEYIQTVSKLINETVETGFKDDQLRSIKDRINKLSKELPLLVRREKRGLEQKTESVEEPVVKMHTTESASVRVEKRERQQDLTSSDINTESTKRQLFKMDEAQLKYTAEVEGFGYKKANLDQVSFTVLRKEEDMFWDMDFPAFLKNRENLIWNESIEEALIILEVIMKRGIDGEIILQHVDTMIASEDEKLVNIGNKVLDLLLKNKECYAGDFVRKIESQ